MPRDPDERPFVFQRLSIGYFLLGFAPPFVVVNPQDTVPLVLAGAVGLVTGGLTFFAFQRVATALFGWVADIDVDAAEPTRLVYFSTYLVVGLTALALLPLSLWVLTTVAPSGELGGGGRRSPLIGALLVPGAVMSVVAEPLWIRVLRTLSVDVIE